MSLHELYPPSVTVAILWHEEGIDLYYESDMMDRLVWLELLEKSIRSEINNPSYLWGFTDAKNRVAEAVIKAIDNCNQCLGFSDCSKPNL